MKKCCRPDIIILAGVKIIYERKIAMNCEKVGALLRQLRAERGMTQQQVADKLMVSDKAVSKWERGLGCPDISIINEISALFGVDTESILSGELCAGERNGGNMKKLAFYVCPECGNILTSSSGGDISCCGRKLAALKADVQDKAHGVTVEPVEDEYYVTFAHEMTKQHYIMFAALVSMDRMNFVRLYPEQDPAFRISRIGGGGTLYYYCSEHGLKNIKI